MLYCNITLFDVLIFFILLEITKCFGRPGQRCRLGDLLVTFPHTPQTPRHRTVVPESGYGGGVVAVPSRDRTARHERQVMAGESGSIFKGKGLVL